MFDTTGRNLKRGKEISHKFNASALEIVRELNSTANKIIADGETLLKKIDGVFAGMKRKRRGERSRKRKNKQKSQRRKTLHYQNLVSYVQQVVAPDFDFTSAFKCPDCFINREGLRKLTRRQATSLLDLVSRGYFTHTSNLRDSFCYLILGNAY